MAFYASAIMWVVLLLAATSCGTNSRSANIGSETLSGPGLEDGYVWKNQITESVYIKASTEGIDLGSDRYNSVYVVGSSVVPVGYYGEEGGFEATVVADYKLNTVFICVLVSGEEIEILSNANVGVFFGDFYSVFPRDYTTSEYPGVFKYSIRMQADPQIARQIKNILSSLPCDGPQEMVIGGHSFGGARLAFAIVIKGGNKSVAWAINPHDTAGAGGSSEDWFSSLYSSINSVLEIAILGKPRIDFIDENHYGLQE